MNLNRCTDPRDPAYDDTDETERAGYIDQLVNDCWIARECPDATGDAITYHAIDDEMLVILQHIKAQLPGLFARMRNDLKEAARDALARA